MKSSNQKLDIFLDTETCGLHGILITIQYAFGLDGKPQIWNAWKHTVRENMDFIETLAENNLVFWNATFDMFHLVKFYNMLAKADDGWILEEHIEELKALDQPWDGYFIKPVGICDLLLYARTGPLQATMDRKPVRIKRVPTMVAERVRASLNKRLNLPDLLFARKSNPKERFTIVESDLNGFVDLQLVFAPSAKLKDVIAYTGLDPEVTKFEDIRCELTPTEDGYAPFHTNWDVYVRYHIKHWETNTLAIEYALKDVKYLQMLYNYFGRPAFNDTNSVLAVQVANVRWYGMELNQEQIRLMQLKTAKDSKAAPLAPNAVKNYLYPDMTEEEILSTQGSTKKTVIEQMMEWTVPHLDCLSMGCDQCDNGKVPHPAAIKAQKVHLARQSDNYNKLFTKLRRTKRLHPSYNVIGTLSNRMGGTDGLNVMGIPKKKDIRQAFTLASEGFVLCGGDFDSFEVAIAVTVFNDPELKQAILSGKKIHGLFGAALFPDMSYDQIVATSKTDNDLYKKGKSGVFAILYGGNEKTLSDRLNVNLEHAEQALENWYAEYPGVKKTQQYIHDQFCSMRQPNGIGSKVEWHDPAEYVETLLGFRRYFTHENHMCKVLFDFAEKPPQFLLDRKEKVTRRDRQQTISGAVRSACFAAAFNIQSKNLRAATNHLIQSVGASITKELQRELWDLQPVGINPAFILPLNIHDEIVACVRNGLEKKTETVVSSFLTRYRKYVELLEMDWKVRIPNWASV